MDDEQKLAEGLVAQMTELGLMGIEVSEELGGAGGSFFDAVLAIEAISTVDPAVAVLVDVHNTLVINALRRWGTQAQQSHWLPKLVAGTVGAYALSEANSGSDAFALQTRAEKTAAGFRLNGRKLWISNAREAGLFIVFATLDASAGYRGITAFLVEKDATGFAVGRKEDKLGIRASSTCELILDGCEVAEENLLGEPGKGYNRDAQRGAHRNRCSDVGACRRCVGSCSPLCKRTTAVRQTNRGVSGSAVHAGGDGHGD
jgi:butyryl-CoA dehydrogenase/short/branched chain acyl-CoA dehydrogenase